MLLLVLRQKYCTTQWDTDTYADVSLEGRVVDCSRLHQMDEEEDVGPLVVLLVHVLLKPLQHTS